MKVIGKIVKWYLIFDVIIWALCGFAEYAKFLVDNDFKFSGAWGAITGYLDWKGDQIKETLDL